MKFTLTLLSDEGKVIKLYDLITWYDDVGLKKEISENGVEALEYIATVLSRSLKEEIDPAIKELLFTH